MTSGESNPLATLVRAEPGLMAWLLTEIFQAAVPGYHHVRAVPPVHSERQEARGRALSLLTVLQERGVAVTADVRDQILACTDLAQLDTWLHHAAKADTIDDVLR